MAKRKPNTKPAVAGPVANHASAPTGVPRRYLSPKDAVAEAPVSLNMIYLWCAQNTLPHYRLGADGKQGKIMIDAADLEAVLARKKVGGPAPQPPPPKPRPIKPRFRHLKL